MKRQFKSILIIFLIIIFLGLENRFHFSNLSAQQLNDFRDTTFAQDYSPQKIDNPWLLTQESSGNPPSSQQQTTKDYPVTLGNQVLFTLVKPIANISPETRAKKKY